MKDNWRSVLVGPNINDTRFKSFCERFQVKWNPGPTNWMELTQQTIVLLKKIMGNIGLKGEGGGLLIKLYYTTLLHII